MQGLVNLVGCLDVKMVYNAQRQSCISLLGCRLNMRRFAKTSRPMKKSNTVKMAVRKSNMLVLDILEQLTDFVAIAYARLCSYNVAFINFMILELWLIHH